jgi:hypothetical protein
MSVAFALSTLLTLLSAAPSRAGASATPLKFDELVAARPGGPLELTDKVKSLAGKRVRIVGFMADMEKLPAGSFFLVPRPLVADESGAGSADLPPNAIRVIVRSARGKPLAHIPRALNVVGTLDLGPRDEPDGLPSFIRILLDGPPRNQKGAR